MNFIILTTAGDYERMMINIESIIYVKEDHCGTTVGIAGKPDFNYIFDTPFDKVIEMINEAK